MAIRVTDPDTDPDRDGGKTCLGGGMHCPSASPVVGPAAALGILDGREFLDEARVVDVVDELVSE